MSVQKDARNEGKLSLEVLARGHAKYVLQITKNEKVFLPEYNHGLTDEIVREAIEINRMIWAANNVLVHSAEDLKLRRKYQERTALLCNCLLADMEIAHSLFHLQERRMEFWSKQVVEIRNKTRAWIKSDADRYKQYR